MVMDMGMGIAMGEVFFLLFGVGWVPEYRWFLGCRWGFYFFFAVIEGTVCRAPWWAMVVSVSPVVGRCTLMEV